MPRQLNLVGKLFFLVQPVPAEAFGIFFESQVALHDQHALARFTDAVYLCRMGKTVQ
jgi:hypothetical protein